MKFTTMVAVETLAILVFAGRDEVAQYFITATQTLLMIKPSSKTEMILNIPLVFILFYSLVFWVSMYDIVFASMISETAILCYLTWVPNTTAFVRISRARIQQMESLQKNKKVKVITNRIAIIATIISKII